MTNAKSKIIKVLVLVAVLLVVALGVIFLGKNLAPQNSSALFGGKLETGYEFAGYSIAYQGTKITTCGITFLNSSTAITAAHCVPSDAELCVGTGSFKPSKQDNIKVLNYAVNTNWTGKPDNDIAVLNLSKNVNLKTFAKVYTPQQNCNYEIVGYGQNESSVKGDFSTKLRKSIQVCITDIVDNLAYMQGSDGGICYGDSGSPVFEKSTNRIVGIVSSIISSSSDTSSFCAIKNIGAIVLPQSFESFILASQFNTSSQNASKALCGGSCVNSTECANGLSCSNKKCTTTTSSCVAQAQAFCNSALSVDCASGNKCIGNTCVPDISQNQQQVAEVFEGINPLVIAGLLALVIFVIIVLLIIPNRKY